MKKKIGLISSYCDNQDKRNNLLKNIKILKMNNLSVFVISPFNLPVEITQECDYFFVTSENPVLDWPERAMFFWKIISDGSENYKISATCPDYGFAGLMHVKRLSQFALNFDYDQFFHLIYDTKITPEVETFFSSDRTCSIFPSKRENKIWPFGLHFMIFDRQNLSEFISHITYENYLNTRGVDAFTWLEIYQEKLNNTLETLPIEDEIYYYQDHDFLDFSPTKKFKMFILKDDEIDGNIKLLFFEFFDEQNLIVKVDGTIISESVKKNQWVDLGYGKSNVKKTELLFGDESFDITKKITNLRHSKTTKSW